MADRRDRREQVGDDGGRPKAHLPPGQHVAHEAGDHHEQEQDDAEDPQHLARLLVGAVIHAARDVDVDGDEEERGAVGVDVAQEPAVIHVAHDAFDGIEGEIDVRRVVHRQHDAGHDLHAQHEGKNAAERPPVIQIARRRIGDERRIDEARDRQPPLQPFHERALRLIGGMSAHGRTLSLAENEKSERQSRRVGSAVEIAVTVSTLFTSCRSTSRAADRPFSCPARQRSRGRRTSRWMVRSHRPGEGRKRRNPAGFYWHPCRFSASVASPPRRAGAHRRKARANSIDDAPMACDRSLSARYSAEHRDHPAAVRLPRHRGAHRRTRRISDLRPRLPPRRHGLSRCRRARPAQLLAGFRGVAARTATIGWSCSPPPRHHPISIIVYRSDDLLLFGRESAGVPREVHEAADARLVIPMRPGLRSLNVALAAAMAAGEALRQTGGL